MRGSEPKGPPGRAARIVYLVVAYVALGMALAALVLPLAPALPFLLIAVWAGSRASPRLHDWIFSQPRLARMVHDWRNDRAVPLYVKWIASAMMALSWSMLVWRDAHRGIVLAIGLLFLALAVYLWTRPTARP